MNQKESGKKVSQDMYSTAHMLIFHLGMKR